MPSPDGLRQHREDRFHILLAVRASGSYRLAGLLRAFLFAPNPAEHVRYRKALERLLSGLPDSVVVESAYRHASTRQAAFAFAQGAIVGTMGNLFASSLGHWIDRRGSLNFTLGDGVWTLVGLAALGTIVSMTAGAIRRFHQSTEIEAIFLAEARRRGLVSEGSEDPDELGPADV